MIPTHRAVLVAVFPFIAAVALSTAVEVAHAQTPTAAPKLDCGAKPEHPGKLGSDTQRKAWQRQATQYLDCYKKHVLDLQRTAEDATKIANEAINDYNATIKEFEAASKTE